MKRGPDTVVQIPDVESSAEESADSGQECSCEGESDVELLGQPPQTASAQGIHRE